jgi:acyl transferase domain-containing protein
MNADIAFPCLQALVTGANLLLALDSSVSMSRMGFTSPDSRCYSFDDRANGYARSEGFGVVVLKRLSDAVRDNDTIRSVIRSTGCNQDGHTPGITQPSKENQAKLIRATYEKAGLDPAVTRYFEAHGTARSIVRVFLA